MPAFYMTAQVTENEALFLRMLARLPVDVLILNPQRTGKGELEDPYYMKKIILKL